MLRVINVNDVNVTKSGYVILNNLSFDIERGSFVSIIGSIGSGKTTLVRLLAGLEKYNGYVNINGYYLDDDCKNDILSGISVVFDEMNEEFLGISAWDNLVIGLMNLGKNSIYISKKVDEICRMFKIDQKVLDKKMVLLDNSLKQRILIAAAVITEPSLLILDDCMHQLSVNERQFIISILNKLKRDKKMSIIMITHNMNDVLKTDRVIVMDSGSIVMDGTVRSVFKQKEKIEKYGLQLPFVIDLSLNLIDKKKISNIYLDEGKLVDILWK